MGSLALAVRAGLSLAGGLGSSGHDDYPHSGGLLVRSDHFVDRFPAPPAETAVPELFAGRSLIRAQAITASPGPVEVMERDASPGFNELEQPTALQAAVRVFSAASGLTVREQHETTFQGHDAVEAVLGRTGKRRLVELCFFSSAERLYVLVAPVGPDISHLMRSFGVVS